MSTPKTATKSDLIRVVAARSDLSFAQAKRAVDALPDAFADLIKDHDKVAFNGFLKVVKRQGVVYRNPRTGEETEPKNAISVKLSPGYRAELA